MVIVLVEHFLDAAGQQRFPAWLHEVAEAAAHYPGFISLRRLSDPDDPAACQMLLEFADTTSLAAWTASPERAALLAAQEPYRQRSLRAQRFLAEVA